MELIKNAELIMASEGRLTLQVPQWEIQPDVGSGAKLVRGVYNSLITYPDEYFMKVNHAGKKHRIAVGREQGFLFLSKKGYYYFKSDLKVAFKNKRGHTWPDFKNSAMMFLAEVETESQKHLQRLRLEEKLKPSPYNKKRVAEMQTNLLNL